MNNIYVDELPKSCNECKLGYFYDYQYCFLRPDLADKDEWCEKEKHCPLKPLTDRLSEERKKVVQELKKMMPIFFGKSEFDWEGFNDYLNQIERGE